MKTTSQSTKTGSRNRKTTASLRVDARNNVRSEVKKIVGRFKKAQSRVHNIIQDQSWVDQARKVAKNQKVELKRLIKSDIKKVKTFLENEKKELNRFQKKIPGEVKKIKSYVKTQKKELERLLTMAKNISMGEVKTPRKRKKTRTKTKTKARTKTKKKTTRSSRV